MRRISLLLFAMVVALPPTLGASPAGASEFDPNEIVFPVVGEVYYSDTYTAPRDGGARMHGATDIMTYGVKGLPVLAAADGVVTWISSSCCHVALDHGGGWQTWYIHLDNDTPGTDDGLGWGIADGIERGTVVSAGQLIGWVGDSGNAEWTAPHLHFEIRKDGVQINPYPYLLIAEGKNPPPPAYTGYFLDDDDSVHESNIDIMFEQGITKGCNPPTNDEYCPERLLTRGEMAAFLRRLEQLPAVQTDYFTDDGDSIFEGDINAFTEVGVGFGCTATEFCPDEPLLRSEMAELLVRNFGYENSEGTDFFTDDENDPFEESINKLAAHGITLGCNPPDNDEFCPDRVLSRAEMATFFARALGLGK